MVTAAMKLKDACSLEESYDKLDSVLKSRVINFTDKDPSSPNYDFSSSHVWM